MPTLSSAHFFSPKGWEELEIIVWDLFKHIWKDPYTQRNGRSGQPQHGVDVYGQPQRGAQWEGVQVKGKNASYGTKVSPQELWGEVEKAKQFEPRLSHFTLVTSAPRDVAIQKVARAITQAHASQGLFGVSVWGWEDVEERLGKFPDVVRNHYPELFSWQATPEFPMHSLELIVQALQNTPELSRGLVPLLMPSTIAPPDVPPVPPANYVLREQLVTQIRNSLPDGVWVALVASTGMGKTQLARAIWNVHPSERRLWVSMPGQASMSLPHLYAQLVQWYGIITGDQGAIDRYAEGRLSAPELAKLTAACTRPGVLLVVDNLPDLAAEPGLAEGLAEIAVAWCNAGNKLLSTGQHPLPQRLSNVMGSAVATRDVPPMDEEDVRQLLAQVGAPPNFHEMGIATHLAGITKGHPILVAAFVQWLVQKNWPTLTATLDALLTGSPLLRAREEARIQVRRLVTSDAARELLDRLSIVQMPFTTDMVWVVGSVAPAIQHSREQFSDLIGPWVRPVNGSRYEVSPLLQTAWQEYLPADLQIQLDHAIASAYLGQRSLTTEQAFQCCMHLFHGQAWADLVGVLLRAMLAIKTPAHAARMEWVTLFFNPRIAWPEEISSVSRLLIRALQVRTLMLLRRPGGTYEDEMDRLIAEVTATQPLAVAFAYFHTSVLLEQAPAEVTARRAILAARAFRAASPSMLDSLEFAPEVGFWGAIPKLKERIEIDALASILREMAPSERTLVFSADPGFDMAAMLADMAYAIEADKPASEQDWSGVLGVLDELESVGRLDGAEPLLWAAIRTRAQALADFMDRTPEALSLLESAQTRVQAPFRFLLLYTQAAILLAKGQPEEAYAKFAEAVSIPVEDTYPVHLTDALGRGMIAGARSGHWEDAKAWCLRNIRRSDLRKGIDTYERLESLGELAWIHWCEGARRKACGAMFGVVGALVANPRPNDPRYKEAFIKVGHVLGWLAGAARRGQAPQKTMDGSLYEVPYPGIMYTRKPVIAQLDKPLTSHSLLAQLAMMASGTGPFRLARATYRASISSAREQGYNVFACAMELERAPIEASLGNYQGALEAVLTGIQAVPVMQAHRGEALSRQDNPAALWAELPSEEQAAIEQFHIFYLVLVPAFIGLVADGVENYAGRGGLTEIGTALLGVQEQLRAVDRWRRLVSYMEAVFDVTDGRGPILQSLRSLGADDHYERLVLYIALASHRDSKPADKAIAQAIVLTHLGSQPFDPVLEKRMSHWVVRTWQVEASERGFRLSAPDLLRRVLRGVPLDADNLPGAARTLLAAEGAAGAHFAIEVRAQLLQMAAHGEGL